MGSLKMLAFRVESVATKKTARMRSSKHEVFLKTKFSIKIGDMCLDFYTLDVRNLGQAEGAHKVGVSARTSQKTTKMLAFCVGSEATTHTQTRACRFRF